jgi:hypothetical protein
MTENNHMKRGFKRKTIVETIQVKMNKWLASIEDETLRAKVKDNYIVTGGAIASMLLGDNPNDFDIYLKDKDVAESLVNYYIKNVTLTDKVKVLEARKSENGGVSVYIKSAGIVRSENENFGDYDYFETTNGNRIESYLDKESFKDKTHFKIAMITSNAISLHGDIQIITRFVGEPEDIHENYDFIHTTNWYTQNDGLVLNQDALESILARELRYVGSLYPICSLFRIKKFINRGWTVTTGEMLKIAWDINNLDLNNMNVLYDQLIGVDAAYFHELIDILKKKSDKELDRTYLFEAINRVFDEKSDNVDEFHQVVQSSF